MRDGQPHRQVAVAHHAGHTAAIVAAVVERLLIVMAGCGGARKECSILPLHILVAVEARRVQQLCRLVRSAERFLKFRWLLP